MCDTPRTSHFTPLKNKKTCRIRIKTLKFYPKIGLPEILVTDNGTDFINIEIITLGHLYNIKHKHRSSHAPWTNVLVEGMNRSIQEFLRCIINGNTHNILNVKLFPLSFNSQIRTTLGVSPYEMVFNQKLRKSIFFTANSSKKNLRSLPTY